MSGKEVSEIGAISTEATTLLKEAAKSLGLSARSYFRILKLSRTIADLEDSEIVKPGHLAEALQYRPRI